MKKTHRPLTMKRYILSKCIIGNGMINGAINAGIFYLLNIDVYKRQAFAFLYLW